MGWLKVNKTLKQFCQVCNKILLTKSSIARRQRFYAYSILIKSFLSRLFSVVCQHALERDITAHRAKKSAKEPPLNPPGPFSPGILAFPFRSQLLIYDHDFSSCMVNIHILPLLLLDTKLMNNILILSEKKLMTLNTKCHKYLFTKSESELRKSTTVI